MASWVAAPVWQSKRQRREEQVLIDRTRQIPDVLLFGLSFSHFRSLLYLIERNNTGIAGCISWVLFISTVLHVSRSRVSSRLFQCVNLVSGVLLVGYGLFFVVKFIRLWANY